LKVRYEIEERDTKLDIIEGDRLEIYICRNGGTKDFMRAYKVIDTKDGLYLEQLYPKGWLGGE
jgi:hypothetical protein